MICYNEQFEKLGLTLPPAPKPLGVYKPCLVDGKYLYLSGHGTVQNDGTLIIGRVGEDMDMEASKKIGKKKIIIGSIIGIVVVGGIALVATKGGSVLTMNREPKEGIAVQVHTVSKNPISSQISSAGFVEAKDKESIYSEINATIAEVIAEVGDQVKVGDVLVRYENDTKTKLERNLAKLNLQLSSANIALGDLTSAGSKQEILQAESSLIQVEKSEKDIVDSIATQELGIEQMTRELETVTKLAADQKELLDAGIVAQKEYDDVVDKIKAIEDKIKTAQIQLQGTKDSIKAVEAQKTNAKYGVEVAYNRVTDKNKQQLISAKQNEIQSLNIQIAELQDEIAKANLEVKSTIDGVVSEVMVVKGGIVGAGTPLVTILDISSLKVKAEVSTFNAPQVVLGQEATIKQDSLEGTEYKGTVTEIAPAAVEKRSGTTSSDIVPVTIEISDTQTQLKPGFNVGVKIKTVNKAEAITLPMLSIMEDSDEDYKYVFVIKDDNTLEKREIQELTIDNIYVEVVGVEVGERVVADPTEDLTEGTLVLIPETGDAQ